MRKKNCHPVLKEARTRRNGLGLFTHFALVNMTQAKFEKAVAIVGNLPKDGPVQTSTDDKLKVNAVRTPSAHVV